MPIFGHSDFDAAFTPNVAFDAPQRGRVRVHQVRTSDVVLPTGQLIACDPSDRMLDCGPFDRWVRPGAYPVDLSLVEYGFGEQDAYRVACAKLILGEGPPVRWEMALQPGERLDDLPLGGFHGYGVDGGTGCFIDQQTANHLSTDDWENLWIDRMVEMLCSRDGNRKYWGCLEIDPQSGGNVVFFDSGDGDGAYPSYWGLDRTGAVSALVTDFGMLIETLHRSVEFNIRDHLGHTLSHPDFAALKVSPRIVPLDSAPDSGLHVELHGNGSPCSVSVVSNGIEHRGDGPRIWYNPEIWAMSYVLNEPLSPDAKLVIRYRVGCQALEPIYDADDLLES